MLLVSWAPCCASCSMATGLLSRAASYLDGVAHSRAVPGYLGAPLSLSLFASCWKLSCLAGHFTFRALLATWAMLLTIWVLLLVTRAAPLVPFPLVGAWGALPAGRCELLAAWVPCLSPHFSALLLTICWTLLWAARWLHFDCVGADACFHALLALPSWACFRARFPLPPARQ